MFPFARSLVLFRAIPRTSVRPSRAEAIEISLTDLAVKVMVAQRPYA
jgi:hypothetical protein